jgi:hypothetical protein
MSGSTLKQIHSCNLEVPLDKIKNLSNSNRNDPLSNMEDKHLFGNSTSSATEL